MEKKPHIHADLIKAWADGAEIERWANTKWVMSCPVWSATQKYRVKPEESKPHVHQEFIDARKRGEIIQGRMIGGDGLWITDLVTNIESMDGNYELRIHPHSSLIKAHGKGEPIQWYDYANKTWTNMLNPSFNPECKYRVAKLVPFDFSDAEKLIGKVIRWRHSGVVELINVVDENGCVGRVHSSFANLFANVKFMDGSPFGKYA